jgi:transcriptional regulator with XRE-family HTH domain
MSNKPPFWQWLLAKLNEAGMDRDEFAAKVGVQKSAVSRWLGNVSKPDVASSRRIARALNVSLAEVLIATDDAEPEDFRPSEIGRSV